MLDKVSVEIGSWSGYNVLAQHLVKISFQSRQFYMTWIYVVVIYRLIGYNHIRIGCRVIAGIMVWECQVLCS